jgi:hypothetical protein
MRRRLITLLVIVLIALLLALLFFFLQSGSGKVSYTTEPCDLSAVHAYASKAPGMPFYTASFLSQDSARCS